MQCQLFMLMFMIYLLYMYFNWDIHDHDGRPNNNTKCIVKFALSCSIHVTVLKSISSRLVLNAHTIQLTAIVSWITRSISCITQTFIAALDE